MEIPVSVRFFRSSSHGAVCTHTRAWGNSWLGNERLFYRTSYTSVSYARQITTSLGEFLQVGRTIVFLSVNRNLEREEVAAFCVPKNGECRFVSYGLLCRGRCSKVSKPSLDCASCKGKFGWWLYNEISDQNTRENIREWSCRESCREKEDAPHAKTKRILKKIDKVFGVWGKQ